MENTEVIQNINQVILALNNIDVKGKSNLANLVGCIDVLEKILDNFIKLEQEKQKNNRTK